MSTRKEIQDAFTKEVNNVIKKIFKAQSINCFNHLNFRPIITNPHQFLYEPKEDLLTVEQFLKFYTNSETISLDFKDIFLNHKYQIWNPLEDIQFRKWINLKGVDLDRLKKTDVLAYVYNKKADDFYIPGIEALIWLNKNLADNQFDLFLKEDVYYYFPGSILRNKNKYWSLPAFMIFRRYDESHHLFTMIPIYGQQNQYWSPNSRIILLSRKLNTKN